MVVCNWVAWQRRTSHPLNLYFQESRYQVIVKVSTLTLGPLAPAIPCCPGVPTAPCINKQWIQSLLLLTATFKKIIHLPSQLFTDQSLAMGHDTVTVPIRDK